MPTEMKAKRKTFGWDAVKLSDAYSLAELGAMATEIMIDPDSANPEHAAGKSINLYTKAAKRKMDALSWAVFYRKQDASRAAAAKATA